MTETPEQKAGQAFNYLTVVTSIILGLGLTQLLSGYARLIQLDRLHSFDHWLYFGWSALLLPVYLMYWWVFWDYRKQLHWTFWSFFFLLSGPIGLYVLTALLLPDFGSKLETFDPTAHYLGIRNGFFGILTLLQLWGILLTPWLRDGFTRNAFLHKYKYAQYVLLFEFAAAFLWATPSELSLWFDPIIFLSFLALMIYLLAAHRRKLDTS